MSHCVLHAGLPKTASTMFQNHLFAQHTEVDFLGTYHERHWRQWNKCRDAQVQELLNELVFRRFKTPDFDRAQKLFHEAIRPSLTTGKVPVWSWESLSLSSRRLRRRRAENLQKVMGPCRVVILLRNPIKLVESVYFQHLKRENVGGKYQRFRRPWLHTIDSWLESSWSHRGAPAHHLDYATTIDLFAEVFGRDQVGVFLFEDLVQNPTEFVQSLAHFIGIDPVQSLHLTQQSRANDRWTEAHLQQIHRIASSRPRRLAFRLANKRGRLRMIGLKDVVGTAEGTRAQASLSPIWKQRIEERTADGIAV